jgi:hypothetical protein
MWNTDAVQDLTAGKVDSVQEKDKGEIDLKTQGKSMANPDPSHDLVVGYTKFAGRRASCLRSPSTLATFCTCK